MKLFATFVILFSLTSIGFAQSSNSRGEPATCTTLPCEVASVNLTAQTAAIPPTIIFTPTTSGLYRISAYLSTSATTGSVWKYAVTWTDDEKARNSGAMPVGPGAFGAFSATVQSVGGKAISYSVGAGAGNSPASTFNLVITVEQL
jgi:hypothetical protein